jgi:hypothetical protein
MGGSRAQENSTVRWRIQTRNTLVRESCVLAMFTNMAEMRQAFKIRDYSEVALRILDEGDEEFKQVGDSDEES